MTINRRQFVRSAVLATAAIPLVRDALAKPKTTSAPAIQYDHDGLIVHRNLDGGDTSQREGWYWLGVWTRTHVLKDPWTVPRALTFSEVAQRMEPQGDGVFYRHPKLPPWNNPHDKGLGYSRDQMIPMVAALGVYGLHDALRRLWNALPQDPVGGTRHTFNGDWTTIFGQRVAHQGDVVGPMTINHFRRAWNEDPSTASDGNGPGGDAELLANVALRLHLAKENMDDTGDDLNLIVMLLLSILRHPTDLTRNAVALYKGRPLSYGSYLVAYRKRYGAGAVAPEDEIRRRIDQGIASGWKPDASGPMGAVRWYHREETGANPALAELYEPIIRRWFE